MKNAWTRPLKPVSAPPGLSRSNSNKPGANRSSSSASESNSSKSNNNNYTKNYNSAPDALRERFLHLTLALVGQNVTLTLTDGSIIEGVLHTFTPFQMSKGSGRGRNSSKEDHSNKYVIKAAAATPPPANSDGNDNGNGNGAPESKQQPGATLIVPAEKVAQLMVKSIRLEQQNRGTGAAGGNSNHNSASGDTFVTDTDISSGGATVSDDLVMASSAWVSGPSDENDQILGGGLGSGAGNNKNNHNKNNGSNHMGRKGLFGTKSQGATATTTGEESLRGGIGGWDQFKANEKQFGVKATFDENLYTTSLDVTNVDRKTQMEAERLAREIEGQTSTNMHLAEERGQALEGDYDEEDLYSGVLVTGGEDAKQKERTKLVLKPRSTNLKKEGAGAVTDDSGSKLKDEDKSAKANTVETWADHAAGDAPKKMAWAAVVAKAEPNKPTSPVKDKKETEASPADSPADSTEEKEEKRSEEKLVSETAKLEFKEEGETSTAASTVPSTTTSTASETKKDGEKATEKPKPKSKLNPSAKSFSFNPAAKSFTPSFATTVPPAPAQAQQAQAPPAEPQHHMGMPMQPHYMQYPQIQPGGMPVGAPMMYQAAFHPQMRYGQGAAPPPYAGMMSQQQQQGQQPQQPPPVAGMQPGQVPTPSVSGGGTSIPGQAQKTEASKVEGESGTGTVEPSPSVTSNAPIDAEKSEEDQSSSQPQTQGQQPQPVPVTNQGPGQAQPMPGQIGYGPGYYPGGMAMHGGRGPVQHQQHYHPQMVGGPQQIPVVPGRNYVYGVPPQHMHQHQHQGNMQQYNQMRGGPGGGFPGGPPYMQGGYNNHRPMDDEMGYRGGRGGRGGRGRRGGRGGRGNGGRGKYHNNYNHNSNGQAGNNGNHQANQQHHVSSDNPDASNAPQDKNANE